MGVFFFYRAKFLHELLDDFSKGCYGSKSCSTPLSALFSEELAESRRKNPKPRGSFLR